MNKIKLAVCGCGFRGIMLIKTILHIEEYDIVAVCDSYQDKAENAQELLRKKNVSAKAYVDYKKMLDEINPDAVLIAASWEMHVEIAVEAMQRKIAVALEVGGAYSEADCWKLVDVWEATQTPLMIMENCCFNKDELLATALVRHGVFGKVNYCHGAYGHDLRNEVAYGDKYRHYRLRNYISRNCDNYPTHELGPIAKLLNINRGNKMCSLVSRSSSSLGLHEYIQGRDDLEYLKNQEFKQGDMVETLITCENGELISLRLDTTLPRFYSREFTVRGTKGMYVQDGNMVFEDGKIDEDFNPTLTYQKHLNNAEKYYEQYLPAMWKEVTQEVLDAGHGGMDYFEFKIFADCLQNGKEMPCDVYDAAAWMAITYLTEKSLQQGGVVVEIPDFTRGKYKNREAKDVIPL